MVAQKEKTLDDLFEDTMKDIYYAEKQIVKNLPKMAKAAQSPAPKAGFEKHLAETEVHVERLEQVFELIGKTPAAKSATRSSAFSRKASPSWTSSRVRSP